MGKLEKVSKELQALLDKAEEMDWSYSAYIETSRGNRAYVEMGQYSPAGEDFNMVIDFELENQAETFLEDLREYADNFDVEEHAEMWLPSRGKGGCPSTLKELLEDAKDIKDMVYELYRELVRLSKELEDLELSEEQIERNDEIYNAVYDMCKVVCENEELEWDMHYIGEIAELAAHLLVERGEKVRFPSVVTENDGTQRIEDYYKPEDK